ncbi:MAG: hypothetical protein ACJAZO_005190 [Myxococcota bacterium]|jgi:hypothetical protein
MTPPIRPFVVTIDTGLSVDVAMKQVYATLDGLGFSCFRDFHRAGGDEQPSTSTTSPTYIRMQ